MIHHVFDDDDINTLLKLNLKEFYGHRDGGIDDSFTP